MNRDEIKTLLMLITRAFPRFEVNPEVVDLWFAINGKWPVVVVKPAVLEFLSSASEWPPTPGQINQACEIRALPRLLRQSADEALLDTTDSLLLHEAREFANKIIGDNARVQYRTPEELAKANHIRRMQWEKVFKARFIEKQQEARSLVRDGLTPERAIAKAVGDGGIVKIPEGILHKLSRLVA